MALMILLGLALAGFLMVLDRRDKRSTEALGRLTDLLEREAKAYREASQQQTAAFMAAIERERDAKRDEIQMLCQRIQAPQSAVIEHQIANAPEANPYPLSEEESVQAQDEKLRAIAEIERLERDGFALNFPGADG